MMGGKGIMNELRGIIRDYCFFSGMDPAHLEILAEGAREATFKAGDVLFREGEPAGDFFLIRKGKVELQAHELADGTVPIQELQAGDVLGWSWLFPPFAWHFRARAVETTDVVVLDGGHLLAAAERDPQFGYELMKRVAQVVIHRLQATRKQLLAPQIETALHA
jgi:CRP/FNR family cyclic AMP-dependent transcriptional regulator